MIEAELDGIHAKIGTYHIPSELDLALVFGNTSPEMEITKDGDFGGGFEYWSGMARSGDDLVDIAVDIEPGLPGRVATIRTLGDNEQQVNSRLEEVSDKLPSRIAFKYDTEVSSNFQFQLVQEDIPNYTRTQAATQRYLTLAHMGCFSTDIGVLEDPLISEFGLILDDEINRIPGKDVSVKTKSLLARQNNSYHTALIHAYGKGFTSRPVGVMVYDVESHKGNTDVPFATFMYHQQTFIVGYINLDIIPFGGDVPNFSGSFARDPITTRASDSNVTLNDLPALIEALEAPIPVEKKLNTLGQTLYLAGQ